MSSGVTISGAVSGLDTASIINQLVSVQTNQQTILRNQQSAVQKRADAYAALATSLSSIGSLADDLAQTGSWAGSSVTSSSSSVSVTATGTANSSITFDVTSVASAHTLVSSTSTGSTRAVVANAGEISITKDGDLPISVTVGDGTLDEVVAAINSSGSGLIATTVRVGPSEYRLQVAATAPGATSSFTIDGLDGLGVAGDGTDAMNVLTAASDATVKIGKIPETAYTVTSSTNTFADRVPGISFTVSREETGVTVSSKIDGNTVADKVSKLVDQVNAVLSDIATKTAYDTTTKTGGVFTGESIARSLQQNLLATVSSSSAPGVQLTRDGRLTFDRTAFLSAFSADPTRVARGFGATGTFTAADGVTGTTVSVSNATKTARPGTYDIEVGALPQREQWSFDIGGDIPGSTIALTRGSTTISYTADDVGTLTDVAAGLNARLTAQHFGVTVSVQDGVLLLTADAMGSASAFEATLDDAYGTQLTAGSDISGSIDGQEATGIGDILSLASGTGGAVGLSVAIDTTNDDIGTSAGRLGSFTYSPGLAQRLSTLVNDATASSTGAVSTAKNGANEAVKRYQQAIDAWNDRLTAYRESLTRQFTTMEMALAKIKSSTSALTSLIKNSSSSSSSNSSD
jgi:flagellar hook-associated protein 2